MTFAFFVVTYLVCFFKADFLNVTVCTMSIFLLSTADQRQFHKFRILVGMIGLSLGYDLVWFFLRSGEMNSDEDGDGGVERSIRKFSFWMAVIGFFFKIVMGFVYWMASLNYADILDEKSKLMRTT